MAQIFVGMLLYIFPASLMGPKTCVSPRVLLHLSSSASFLGMTHSKPGAIFGGYKNTYLDMRVSLLPSVKNQSLSLQSQEPTPPCLELLRFLPWTCGKGQVWYNIWKFVKFFILPSNGVFGQLKFIPEVGYFWLDPFSSVSDLGEGSIFSFLHIGKVMLVRVGGQPSSVGQQGIHVVGRVLKGGLYWTVW